MTFIAGKIINIFFNDLGKLWKILFKTISPIGIGIIMLCWFMIYIPCMFKNLEYTSFKSSIEMLNKNNNFVINKIIESNSDLQKAKYWNDSMFDFFIPDDYANLDFIEFKKEVEVEKPYKICFDKVYNYEFNYANKEMIEEFLSRNNIKEEDIIKAEYNTNGIFWILWKKY
jgi:hypothetical protein